MKTRKEPTNKGVRPYRETFYRPEYQPTAQDLLCAFRIRVREGVSIVEAASAVAAESSTGTWTVVADEITTRLQAYVYDIQDDVALIAYPLELFEQGSLPNILSSVAGNVFGMKIVQGLRLEDIRFPTALVRSFPGPVAGLTGVRKRLGIYNRPLTGSTIKPKLGLTAQEHAQVAYETLRGGADSVKDDENLGNQPFNPFDERIRRTLEQVRRAEAETGEKKVYWPNITAPYTEEMIRRAEVVAENGGLYVMVDFLTCGFSALASLRRAVERLGLMIHAHRAMHSAFDRLPYHGVEFRVLAKWARLAGVDNLHTGTGVGKLEGGITEMQERQTILRDSLSQAIGGMWFDQEWANLKAVIPVASGGLHPGHTAVLHQIFGNDAFYLYGGGIHGHPGGSRAGAMAVRAAVEAVAQGIPLSLAAKESPELRDALELWSEVTF